MALTRKTVADLLVEVRDFLDEPYDPDTNFWTNSFLLRQMSRGFREVWQTARDEDHHWFLKRVKSTDEPFVAFGGDPDADPPDANLFDPADMQLVQDMDAIPLPADFAELRLIEQLTADDASSPTVLFSFADISHPTFRALTIQRGSEAGSYFKCDIVWREDGPFILLTPKVGATVTPVDIVIEYVKAPPPIAIDTALTGLGFDDVMLDAVVAFVVYEARVREGDEKDIAEAKDALASRLGLVRRKVVTPRQTREAEYVVGFMEDDPGGRFFEDED